MSSRVLFGPGAVGMLIERIQRALVAHGQVLKTIDRLYGKDTVEAVREFQTANSIPSTGTVDVESWRQLTGTPIPTIGERSVQLTATFEGHGFGLAVGNFDGALLTWGIVGFTVISGEIRQIVEAVNASHPELVARAFGAHKSELLNFLQGGDEAQREWANAHTMKNKSLAEPWRSMFAAFGAFPEVQAEQMKHVTNDYLQPAIKTARKLRLSSELGLALCFDIQVQNGGIKPAVMKSLIARPDIPEETKRHLIANAAADSARASWREDVRQRKLTLANGRGSVHGHEFELENWGLSSEFAADELVNCKTAAQAAAD